MALLFLKFKRVLAGALFLSLGIVLYAQPVLCGGSKKIELPQKKPGFWQYLNCNGLLCGLTGQAAECLFIAQSFSRSAPKEAYKKIPPYMHKYFPGCWRRITKNRAHVCYAFKKHNSWISQKACQYMIYNHRHVPESK